jgi:MFS family permease
MLMVAGLFGMFFLGVLYMQRVLGYDAIETGLAFLPVAVLIGAFSLAVTPRLTLRLGDRPVLLAGLPLIIAGLAFFARVPEAASYTTDILPSMVLMGAGAGLSFPSLMNLAMSGATPADAGLVSGLVNTTLQVGGALGLAVLATLASSRTEDLVADGEGSAAALTGGYSLAFIVAAALVGVALAVAATVIRSRAPAREETAPQEPSLRSAEGG